MKPDLVLQKNILQFLENKADTRPDLVYLEGVGQPEISYNICLLHEAGLIVAQADGTDDYDFDCWLAARCRSSGHDFLKALNNSSIISRLQAELKNVPFSMLPTIAAELLKASIQSVLN